MQRTVTVTGTGAATVVPDIARLRVGASHRAPTVAEAVAGLGASARLVTQVAVRVVDARHVATTGLQVWPRHDNEGRPDGVEASQQVSVRCPDLDAASQLVADLAAEVGEDLRIEGLALEVSDTSDAVLEARESAFSDARARAEHLAHLAGRVLGDVLEVVEGPRGAQPMPGGARMALAAMPIEPGEQSVHSSLQVTWQLA